MGSRSAELPQPEDGQGQGRLVPVVSRQAHLRPPRPAVGPCSLQVPQAGLVGAGAYQREPQGPVREQLLAWCPGFAGQGRRWLLLNWEFGSLTLRPGRTRVPSSYVSVLTSTGSHRGAHAWLARDRAIHESS